MTYLMFFTVTPITSCISLKIFIHFRFVVRVSHAGVLVVVLLRVRPQSSHSLLYIPSLLGLCSQIVLLKVPPLQQIIRGNGVNVIRCKWNCDDHRSQNHFRSYKLYHTWYEEASCIIPCMKRQVVSYLV